MEMRGEERDWRKRRSMYVEERVSLSGLVELSMAAFSDSDLYSFIYYGFETSLVGCVV